MTKKILYIFISTLCFVQYTFADIPIVTVYNDDNYNGYFKVVATKGIENGHEWVNMGQNVMWATKNIGSSSISDKGDLYAWGETTINSTMHVADGSYEVSTYIGDNNQLQLSAENDVASVNWGGSWRMPKLIEWRTLMQNCTWIWTTYNENQGYMVSHDSDSLFLPHTYDAYPVSYSSFHGYCNYASYWSSTRDSYTSSYAKAIGGCQYSNGPSETTSAQVEGGKNIRPICVPSISNNLKLLLKNGNSLKMDTILPEMGQRLQLFAKASYGFHFAQWNDGNTENPRIITITQDSTFTSEFAKNEYTTVVESSNEEWGTTSGGTLALYLDEIQISATPNYGYHFDHWNDGNKESPRTITVTEDKTYTAIFAKNIYEVTKQCNSEQGSISGVSQAEYLDFVTLTAVPNYGYHFTQWSDGLKDNPRVAQITQDTTFTAEFAYDRVGTCGKDLALVWSYDPVKKVLTIGNAGSFDENMRYGVEAPNEMTELVIGNNVTAIGTSAFANLPTLTKVTIGELVKTIGDQAFYNCVNLETIFNYRKTPNNAYSTAFDGVDKFECKLYVLAGSIDLYKNAAVWRDFYYTYAIGAEEKSVTTDSVTVEPSDNTATLTWPTNDNAATYTIQITKDGEVFCTLIFNMNGQLVGIAFAPSRNGAPQAHAAVMTANGMQFTVTGLNSATNYGFTLTAKDSQDAVLATYEGEFTTTSNGEYIPESLENVDSSSAPQKVMVNGQIFILRGNKTYNLQGQLVNQ